MAPCGGTVLRCLSEYYQNIVLRPHPTHPPPFAGKAPCGGTVLRCLSEHYEDIDTEDCKGEVFYFMKMEVRDFK